MIALRIINNHEHVWSTCTVEFKSSNYNTLGMLLVIPPQIYAICGLPLGFEARRGGNTKVRNAEKLKTKCPKVAKFNKIQSLPTDCMYHEQVGVKSDDYPAHPPEKSWVQWATPNIKEYDSRIITYGINWNDMDKILWCRKAWNMLEFCFSQRRMPHKEAKRGKEKSATLVVCHRPGLIGCSERGTIWDQWTMSQWCVLLKAARCSTTTKEVFAGQWSMFHLFAGRTASNQLRQPLCQWSWGESLSTRALRIDRQHPYD